MVGDRYGRLVVVEDRGGSVARRVKCECDCGNSKKIRFYNLVSGNTKSCGCMVRVGRVTHGQSYGPEYRTWRRMKERCLNRNSENYGRYGGSGVTICDRWRTSFINFYEDMGSKPGPWYSIDRINGEVGYEPGNCRWATSRQQSRNRKSNRMISIRGTVKPLVDWVEQSGLKYKTVYSRLKKGVDPEVALGFDL